MRSFALQHRSKLRSLSIEVGKRRYLEKWIWLIQGWDAFQRQVWASIMTLAITINRKWSKKLGIMIKMRNIQRKKSRKIRESRKKFILTDCTSTIPKKWICRTKETFNKWRKYYFWIHIFTKPNLSSTVIVTTVSMFFVNKKIIIDHMNRHKMSMTTFLTLNALNARWILVLKN